MREGRERRQDPDCPTDSAGRLSTNEEGRQPASYDGCDTDPLLFSFDDSGELVSAPDLTDTSDTGMGPSSHSSLRAE